MTSITTVINEHLSRELKKTDLTPLIEQCVIESLRIKQEPEREEFLRLTLGLDRITTMPEPLKNG